MTRGRRVLALAAATALTVTACSESATDQSDAAERAANDPQSVTGTVTFWDTSDATSESPAYKELVKRFEEKYPKITVDYVNVPFDGADDKFKTAAASGDGAPDVMRSDVGWTPTFAALGYLQPLDGTPALELRRLPSGADGQQRLRGQDLRCSAGDRHARPAVQQGALRQGRHRRATLHMGGTAQGGGDPGGEDPGHHGHLHQRRLLLPAAVRLRRGRRLRRHRGRAHHHRQPRGEGRHRDRARADRRRCGHHRHEREQVHQHGGRLQEQVHQHDHQRPVVDVSDTLTGKAFSDPDNLGVAPVPAGPKGQGGPVGGHNYTIYAGSDNLAASYLFVQFMNSPESQAYVAAQNNTLPTRESVYEVPEVADNEVIEAFAEPIEQAVPRPPAPGAGTLYDLFTPFYEQILGGQTSLEDGLAQAQRKAKDAVPGYES